MAIGFDYGTANCSVAQVVNQEVKQIPLLGNDYYIPSTLSAPTAETVSEYLFRCLDIKPIGEIGESVLSRAMKMNRNEGIDVQADDVRFGQPALDLYLEDPKEIYYVKSPKSFLGTMGLRDLQLSFFEDLVCAMMANVKRQAEASIQQDITQAVIGRPVNFQGRGGDASNLQAQGILERAATRAGFKQVEFQFEPVAAGLEYESTLAEEQNVLVVDIGGGTTDCSMIRMGPKWVGKVERSESLLGHTGQLIGGNDLDIFVAFKNFMSEFGIHSLRKSSLAIPITQFWNPIAINDVQAQRRFYGSDNLIELKSLMGESLVPEKLARLIKVQQNSLGYGLIKEAENAKIALGEQAHYEASIDLKNELLTIPMLSEHMKDAIADPTRKIQALVKEALAQSQTKPDVIYMTGGSARSPILRDAIQSVVPSTPIVAGNYFGSVTAGLARWAELRFK